MISNLTGTLIVLLLIDSVVLLYFTYKQKWPMFFVCLAIAGILDVIILKTGS